MREDKAGETARVWKEKREIAVSGPKAAGGVREAC